MLTSSYLTMGSPHADLTQRDRNKTFDGAHEQPTSFAIPLTLRTRYKKNLLQIAATILYIVPLLHAAAESTILLRDIRLVHQMFVLNILSTVAAAGNDVT